MKQHHNHKTRGTIMRYARRKLLKLGLGAVPLTYFLANRTSLLTATATAATPAATKPNSKFSGVQIGIIAPYSFRGLPSTAEDLLHNMVELGLSAVELQNDPVERFAGAPGGGGRGGGPGGPGAIPGLNADQQAALTAVNESLAPKNQVVSAARTALAQAAFSDAAAIQTRLAALTTAELELANARADAIAKLQSSAQRLNTEQINALIAQAVPPPPGGGRGGPGGGANPEMTKWRASVSMDKFKALRKMYNDAGVSIYGFKLDLRLNSPDSEYEYAFNVCEALGANQLTMELPSDPAVSKRIGEYAAKRKIWAGYHAHTQAHLHAWDEAFSQSPYNGANIDIGHYVAGTSQSPMPFIEKNHARITSMHLKDRKINNGPNTPWGQGDTPIKEVLQSMKKEHYTFPATIELEYNTPQGSTVMAELAKCVQFCKDALA